MKVDIALRNATICELRRQGNLLEDIAAKFGITGERVRQITNGIEPSELPEKREKRLAAEADARRISLFKRMRGWLWEAGYRRCSRCQLWDSFSKKMQLCRRCNAARARAYLKTPAGQQYRKTYQRNHAQQYRQYVKKWEKANPDWVKERNKRNYERRKEKDPEKLREIGRRKYHALRSQDPEKLRDQWKKAYWRKKAKELEVKN